MYTFLFAIIGLMLYGFPGMLIGGLLGSLFSSRKVMRNATFTRTVDFDESRRPQSAFYASSEATAAEKNKRVYFVCFFSMLAKIATADGILNSQAKERVDQFIDSNMNPGGESAALARSIFDEACGNREAFDSYAQMFYAYFGHDTNMLVTLMGMLFSVAAADGSMSAAEENLINRAGSVFRFPQYMMDNLRARYTGRYSYSGYSSSYSSGSYSSGSYSSGPARASSHSYTILGLTREATDEEVKKAYRKLSREYHPDMVASKGLPEEFASFATEKFKEINEAYQEIKAERGFK